MAGEELRDVFKGLTKPLLQWSGVVLVLWLLSAVTIIWMLPGWPSRGQFGDLFGAVNSLFSGLAFAGIVLALLLQNHGLRLQIDEITKAHDWNRRRSAHEIVFEASIGRFRALRAEIETKIDIYNRQQTFLTVRNDLTREDLLKIDAVLNYLENVCLLVKNHVVDDDIVYDALSEILLCYWRWAKPYIDENRRDVSEELWQELDPIVARWGQQTRDALMRLEQARNDARKPGRPKL